MWNALAAIILKGKPLGKVAQCLGSTNVFVKIIIVTAHKGITCLYDLTYDLTRFMAKKFYSVTLYWSLVISNDYQIYKNIIPVMKIMMTMVSSLKYKKLIRPHSIVGV